jgi:uncharacterized protein (TIGR03435 family)
MRTEELLALGVFGRGSQLSDRIESLLSQRREFSPRVSTARVFASMIAVLGLVAAGSLSPRWIAFAQGKPAFEAASVKIVKFSDYAEPVFEVKPGGLWARRVPLRELIGWAYRVDGREISGTKLLDGEFFEITATAGGPVTEDQLRLMLRTLLEERFKLVSHREEKILPIYTLVVDKGGPRLRESKEPARSGGKIGFTDRAFMFQMTDRISRLVEMLPMFLEDRPVMDRTGLTAVYDIDLQVEMEPEQIRRMPGAGAAFDGFGYAPGVFDAMSKLGLKLEASKRPVDILTIDRVEMPDAN